VLLSCCTLLLPAPAYITVPEHPHQVHNEGVTVSTKQFAHPTPSTKPEQPTSCAAAALNYSSSEEANTPNNNDTKSTPTPHSQNIAWNHKQEQVTRHTACTQQPYVHNCHRNRAAAGDTRLPGNIGRPGKAQAALLWCCRCNLTNNPQPPHKHPGCCRVSQQLQPVSLAQELFLYTLYA
jgi:hypothetical protein